MFHKNKWRKSGFVAECKPCRKTLDARKYQRRLQKLGKDVWDSKKFNNVFFNSWNRNNKKSKLLGITEKAIKEQVPIITEEMLENLYNDINELTSEELDKLTDYK
jgi:hypothetical protein